MPFPAATSTNDEGHLVVDGCDLVEVVAEFGTPAYLFSVSEMRSRARAYVEAFSARSDRFEVLFASKALPVTAAYRLFAEEGLSVDVASGGELTMALAAGYDPERIYMHGNNKTDEELELADRSGVGTLIVDSFDEIDRCDRILDRKVDAMVRVTPGIEPSTHDYI
ncbi:MAG: diaminopimelate decarboxylase family protein, partial [Solirubrobacterales bacterium]